jgi:hypothetical protein
VPTVYCQLWEESERGWGQKPDGYSLHLSLEDRSAFIDSYWKDMPDAVQDVYERPRGEPYKASLRTNSKLYQMLLKSKNGIRLDGSPPK